jgi:hypothetical protein
MLFANTAGSLGGKNLSENHEPQSDRPGWPREDCRTITAAREPPHENRG